MLKELFTHRETEGGMTWGDKEQGEGTVQRFTYLQSHCLWGSPDPVFSQHARGAASLYLFSSSTGSSSVIRVHCHLGTNIFNPPQIEVESLFIRWFFRTSAHIWAAHLSGYLRSPRLSLLCPCPDPSSSTFMLTKADIVLFSSGPRLCSCLIFPICSGQACLCLIMRKQLCGKAHSPCGFQR